MMLEVTVPAVGCKAKREHCRMRWPILLWVIIVINGEHCLAAEETEEIETKRGNGYKDYSGHSVIRVTPGHEDDLHIIQSLKNNHPEEVDFWKKPTVAKRSVDIQLSPTISEQVIKILETSGIDFSHLTQNVQSLIDEERPTRSADENPFHYTNLSNYHNYEDIMRYIDAASRECRMWCMAYNIGNSYEGRQLKVLQIGAHQEGKPGIWIDAGLHAREWIAPATALFLISKLVNPRDGVSRYLVNHYTWYILPLANPDGYHFTWVADRLWRKTRSDHPISRCKGADPNRNWNFHWGGLGTSSNPCSEDYRGVAPFSEPETRAMSNYLLSIKDRLAVYLSLHSYGQYWLTPWGFTYQLPEDYAEMVNLGQMAADTVRRRFGTEYSVGASSQLLYLAPGGSDDWAKGVAGIKFAYTVELKDTGRHGFILPPHLIRETGREMMNAIRSLAVGVLRLRRRAALRTSS